MSFCACSGSLSSFSLSVSLANFYSLYHPIFPSSVCSIPFSTPRSNSHSLPLFVTSAFAIPFSFIPAEFFGGSPPKRRGVGSLSVPWSWYPFPCPQKDDDCLYIRIGVAHGSYEDGLKSELGVVVRALFTSYGIVEVAA